MDTVKQNSKGVNTRKCNSVVKRLPVKAILHGIAGTHACMGTVVSTRASIVVLALTGVVVPSCCRMTTRVCSGSDERRRTRKPVKQCIYKSIFSHILKDSK
jgi:hypothetical protein